MNRFDVIVIGAGVVGCAIARHFTLEGARVLTIEKADDLLDGASKGNSAILHTGFDAPPQTLEQHCIADGYQSYMHIHKRLGLSVHRVGALVIAWTEEEENTLPDILERAHLNGAHDAHLVGKTEIAKKEPNLSRTARSGVFIPGESIIDPWTSPYLYQLQAIENGATLARSCEVLDGNFNGAEWQLKTTRGTFFGTSVVNCAGLYGDALDQLLMGRSTFQIKPRKGQFLIYDKPARSLINSIILPVPTRLTKGVVVCPTVFGNLLVGPTAEEQESREDAPVDNPALQQLAKKGEQILPAIKEHTVTASYAGIRPATGRQDYCIETHKDKNLTSVNGIRSTGLSAALGIANYVFKIHSGAHHSFVPLKEYRWPTANPIDESMQRDWQKPNNGGIVCHCEWVTKREIHQALNGPLPVGSLSGLKRRTRVTMGRCQGFYCTAQLKEITRGCFDDSPSVRKTRVESHRQFLGD